MFQNVIFGWLTRRALELGGIFGVLFAVYQSLPPVTQDAIQSILTGNWQSVTLGALFPILVALWGYVWSFRSTVKPQVVTADKRQIPLSPVGAAEAEAVAKVAPPRKRTLIDVLTGR